MYSRIPRKLVADPCDPQSTLQATALGYVRTFSQPHKHLINTTLLLQHMKYETTCMNWCI